jgi:hypothetical protein
MRGLHKWLLLARRNDPVVTAPDTKPDHPGLIEDMNQGHYFRTAGPRTGSTA